MSVIITIKSLPLPGQAEQFNPNKNTVIGLDIGRTNIKAVLIKQGKVLIKTDYDTEIEGRPFTADNFLERLIGIVHQLSKQAGISVDEIDAIGLGWPGAVKDNKIAGLSSILVEMQDIGDAKKITNPTKYNEMTDIANVLSRRLNNKVTVIDNDGTVEAFCAKVTLPNIKNALFMKLGTSLAGGYINARGQISSDLSELSKAVTDMHPKAPEHKRKKIRGLSKEYVSSAGVVRTAKLLGLDKDLKPELDKKEKNKGKLESLDVGMALERGNEKAIRSVTEVARYLADLAAEMHRFYGMESIIIAGGVTQRETGKLLRKTAQGILDREYSNLHIAISLSNQDVKYGGAIGAAQLANKKVQEKKASSPASEDDFLGKSVPQVNIQAAIRNPLIVANDDPLYQKAIQQAEVFLREQGILPGQESLIPIEINLVYLRQRSPPGFLGLVYVSETSYKYVHIQRTNEGYKLYIPEPLAEYLSNIHKDKLSDYICCFVIHTLAEAQGKSHEQAQQLHRAYLKSKDYPEEELEQLLNNITHPAFLANFADLEELFVRLNKPRSLLYKKIRSCAEVMNVFGLTPEQLIIGLLAEQRQDTYILEKLEAIRARAPPRKVLGIGGGGGFVYTVLKALCRLNLCPYAGMPSTDNGGSTGLIQRAVYKSLGFILGMGDGLNVMANFFGKAKAKLGVLDYRPDRTGPSLQEVVVTQIQQEINNPKFGTLELNLFETKDFIWFVVNQLNLARIIDEDFVHAQDKDGAKKYPDFNIQGNSLRNLNFLAVYHKIGAFNERARTTDEQEAQMASYLLEMALGLDSRSAKLPHVIYVTYGECISYITLDEKIPEEAISELEQKPDLKDIRGYISGDGRTIYGQRFIDKLRHNRKVVDFGLARKVKVKEQTVTVEARERIVYQYKVDSNISHLKVSREYQQALEEVPVITLGAGSLFSSQVCQLAIPGVVDILVRRINEDDLISMLILNHVNMDETNFLTAIEQVKMIERIASRAVSRQTVQWLKGKTKRNYHYDKIDGLYRDDAGDYYIRIGDLFNHVIANRAFIAGELDRILAPRLSEHLKATTGNISLRYGLTRSLEGNPIFTDRDFHQYFLVKGIKDPARQLWGICEDRRGQRYTYKLTSSGDDVLVDGSGKQIPVILRNIYVKHLDENRQLIKEYALTFEDLRLLSFYDQDPLIETARSERGRYRGALYLSGEAISYLVQRGLNEKNIHRYDLVSMQQKILKAEGELQHERFLGLDAERIEDILRDILREHLPRELGFIEPGSISSPITIHGTDEPDFASSPILPKLNVVFVSSEITPLSRTGGLGDVSHDLPMVLMDMGINVPLFSLRYETISSENLIYLGSVNITILNETVAIKIWQTDLDGMQVYLLEDDKGYTKRPYQGDVLRQAICLSKGTFEAIRLLHQKGIIAKPDIMQANDWLAALIPTYLKTIYNKDELFADVASIFTIHNFKGNSQEQDLTS
jgi:predicted NBD/HSP70 family sugar kinase